MEYIRLKTEEVNRLPFIKHCVIEGSETRSLEIEVDGKMYCFSTPYSNVQVSVEKPDVIEDRYEVSGKINDIDIMPKVFEDKLEAEAFMSYHSTLVLKVVKFNATKQRLVA